MRVVSWNVLADDYIKPGFYPTVRDVHLDPAWRRGQVVARLRQTTADVLCLQECVPEVFEAVARPGYFARKSGKPDGVATFVRGPVSTVETIRFSDGSGHVALIVRMGHIGIVNVHIKWGDPASGQVRELLDALRRFACDSWIVCGDFNSEPGSPPLAEFRGFVDAYADAPAPTCNSNRKAKRIDYILHSPTLRSAPSPIPAIADDTPLPSADEPSDHLAIAAEVS